MSVTCPINRTEIDQMLMIWINLRNWCILVVFLILSPLCFSVLHAQSVEDDSYQSSGKALDVFISDSECVHSVFAVDANRLQCAVKDFKTAQSTAAVSATAFISAGALRWTPITRILSHPLLQKILLTTAGATFLVSYALTRSQRDEAYPGMLLSSAAGEDDSHMAAAKEKSYSLYDSIWNKSDMQPSARPPMVWPMIDQDKEGSSTTIMSYQADNLSAQDIWRRYKDYLKQHRDLKLYGLHEELFKKLGVFDGASGLHEILDQESTFADYTQYLYQQLQDLVLQLNVYPKTLNHYLEEIGATDSERYAFYRLVYGEVMQNNEWHSVANIGISYESFGYHLLKISHNLNQLLQILHGMYAKPHDSAFANNTHDFITLLNQTAHALIALRGISERIESAYPPILSGSTKTFDESVRKVQSVRSWLISPLITDLSSYIEPGVYVQDTQIKSSSSEIVDAEIFIQFAKISDKFSQNFLKITQETESEKLIHYYHIFDEPDVLSREKLSFVASSIFFELNIIKDRLLSHGGILSQWFVNEDNREFVESSIDQQFYDIVSYLTNTTDKNLAYDKHFEKYQNVYHPLFQLSLIKEMVILYAELSSFDQKLLNKNLENSPISFTKGKALVEKSFRQSIKPGFVEHIFAKSLEYQNLFGENTMYTSLPVMFHIYFHLHYLSTHSALDNLSYSVHHRQSDELKTSAENLDLNRRRYLHALFSPEKRQSILENSPDVLHSRASYELWVNMAHAFSKDEIEIQDQMRVNLASVIDISDSLYGHKYAKQIMLLSMIHTYLQRTRHAISHIL